MREIYIALIVLVLILLAYYVHPAFIIGTLFAVIATKIEFNGGWGCWDPTAEKGNRCVERVNGTELTQYSDKWRCENNCTYQIELIEKDPATGKETGQSYNIKFPVPIQFLQELSTTRRADFADFLGNQNRIDKIARYCNTSPVEKNSVWDLMWRNVNNSVSVSITQAMLVLTKVSKQIHKVVNHIRDTFKNLAVWLLNNNIQPSTEDEYLTKFREIFVCNCPEMIDDESGVFSLLAKNTFIRGFSKFLTKVYDIKEQYKQYDNVTELATVGRKLDEVGNIVYDVLNENNVIYNLLKEETGEKFSEFHHEPAIIKDIKDGIEGNIEIIVIPVALRFRGGSHANLIIYNRITNTVFHFEPHVSSGYYVDNTMVDFIREYFKKNLNLEPDIVQLANLYTCPYNIEYKPTQGESLRLQGSDELCQTWTKLALLLYINNPNVPLKAIFNELSYRHSLRYIVQFLYYLEHEAKQYYTPENSTPTTSFSLGNVASKDVNEMAKIQ
jgi:hypothetical protein